MRRVEERRVDNVSDEKSGGEGERRVKRGQGE